MSFLVRFGRLVLKSNNKILNTENSLALRKNGQRSIKFISVFARRNYADFHNNYASFDDMVKDRRCQAKRSVLVQVNSELSFPELHTYCSHFGNILGVHHYTLSNGQKHFLLVEFHNEEDATNLLSSCCFAKEGDTIPVKSPFLWFRSLRNGKNKIQDIYKSNRDVDLVITHGCQIPSEAAVMDSIIKSGTVSEQIEKLYTMTCLNDLGIRLRYLVARQIELALFGLYPDVSVRPFGSSVNGFGKMRCDLDLLLRFSEDDKDDSTSRLVFHTKRSTTTGRLQQQRYMEIIGDMIQLFIPGCSYVRRILQARIPIIKYNQDYAGVECDLSMASMSGVYMSELMYTLGSLDNRVRPLVFTIRKWAESVGVTNPSPGRWITNFPLTLMVLFFLQNDCNGPILPSYNYLKKAAGKDDIRITDDQVDCTFLRDKSKIKYQNTNKSSLGQLLFQFFEFYASFDFLTRALSINEGKAIVKPDHSPLYIVNPLETSLNVSKNVSYEECERLRIEIRNAAWHLESSNSESNQPFGLPLILDYKGKPVSIPIKTVTRMVSVKDLFNEDVPSNETMEADPKSKNSVKNTSIETDTKLVENNIDVTKDAFDQIKNEIVFMAQTNNNKRSNNYAFKNDLIRKQVGDVKQNKETELRRQRKILYAMDPKNSTNRSIPRRTKKR